MSDKCPRGFVVSESTGKCIPEGKSISDRLMLKYERYFFKEGQEMEKCKPGYRWCSKTNKCVEDTDDKLQGKRLGRGQGEGPMGKPFKEAEDMVDIAFDEGFEVFGKLKVAKSKVDDILDNLQLECGCQGGGMGMGKGHMGSQDYPGSEEEDEYEDAYDAMDHVGPNDIDVVPDQNTNKLYRSVRKQMGEWRHVTKESKNERYKKFFRSMLDTYGVESPDDIDDDEKKKEFFNKVNRGWQTKNESVDNFLDEISKGEILGLGASLVVGSALTYFWYRQDVKGCYKRFANDKEQLKRCLTHYKYCSHLARSKDNYEKCLKEKGKK